ncbi:Ephrin type-B receptor 5 [Merluccius polli]|uniref:Ephrin type-B receptor 5 n=1 Tax=Merluccius polli TaxID=89951 RepID=A0AA47MWF9_MERPO|nr:Ephrin type-B receptor 5 [Merluccius polli]
MWSIVLSLCLFLQPNSAEEVMLLDTTESTSELGWTTYPDTGWDEVSVLDDRGKLIRTFEVCNVNQNPRLQDNWLATPFLFRDSAPRVFVTLRFSVRDCASLRSPSPTCRETLTLYYKQADSQRELERTWAAEPSSGEKESREGWVKVDTIAADKSFSKVEPSSPHQYQPNRYRRINIKTRSFAPLTRNGFVLAVVDSGACVSLMGVSIFYRRCPATNRHLASYPPTPSGAEPTALVPVGGTCVLHSQPQAGTAPRMHCNAEGEWMVPVGGCICDKGYEPNVNGSVCLACPVGYFKSVSGSVPCSVCPSNSRTSQEGSLTCGCRSGFYRSATDANSTSCTSQTHSPLSICVLRRHPSPSPGSTRVVTAGCPCGGAPPTDMGGRSEVWYGVVCRICPSADFINPASCSWCGEDVSYAPTQTKLRQTKVALNNLLTRVTYLIQVQAMNEVSSLSPFPPRYTSINFTTSQSVPSQVPMMHQLSRAPDSITLSWPQPDRPNGDILEYQLRYYDKGSDEDSATSVFSETNTGTVSALIPGSIYAFQIRARNERGYGPYSHTIYFTTQALDHSQQIQNRLPLLVGSVMGGAAFLLVVVAIVVVVVFHSKRRESPYSDRLQRYISNRGGVKYYVDPSTYEDPSEAVKEFAREIDPTHLKIEEVMKAVADQFRLPAPVNCPPALHSLMLQCWQADRGDRPGFDSLLSSLDRLIRHPASLKAEHTRSCSQPLLSPTPTDLSSVATVSDWLTALKMDRYKDEFERAHLDSLDRVSRLTMEDVQNLGVNLLGHQRKIVSAAQQLRSHLIQGQVELLVMSGFKESTFLPAKPGYVWEKHKVPFPINPTL